MYSECTDAEKKQFMQTFIERIDIFLERRKDGNWIRNIKFQFPVPIIKEGKEIAQIKGISLDKEKSDEHMVSLEKLSTLETVVLLSKGAKGPVDLCSARTEVERRMVDSRKVKVDFSLEDMDLSEFKGKATHEQIRAYVLEQTGLKVSSLYIAQIKKKCGLDVDENFNLVKSDNARQPQCTPEKEDAIVQAFRHFEII